MIKKLIVLCVTVFAAMLSYGSLLSEWYADHHDNPLEWVIVGQEAVETKNVAGGYRFQTADAELVNTAYGWELVLGHNEIYGCGIKAEGDLIIRLKAGMRTLITPVEEGNIRYSGKNKPTEYYKVNSKKAFGIDVDRSLLIYGPGELVIEHLVVGEYYNGRGIRCTGSELKIANGAMVRVEVANAVYAAIGGVDFLESLGNLSIANAVVESVGGIGAKGNVVIDHSIVNVISPNYALQSWEKIYIKDSCCSFIAKKGVALSVRGLLETDGSIIYAYSQNNHCVVSSYDVSSKSGGCVFGKGFYRFATNGGEDYAAIDSSSSYSDVIINGATIETCAPGGTGIDMTLPRLTMNSGLIRHRNSMDFKKDFLVGRELLDAYGLLISWNSVGIELGYSPEKVIGVFLGETLVNWLQKQSIDNPKGKALRNIRGKITLNDGTIISEESEKGIYGDDLWGGVIHIIKGGSLQGPIWPAPVDTSGNELACVTNVISNGTAYEQVTSGWTAKLPKDYNTSSLFVDGEKKLYFWVPPDIGFYKPDEWSSPFFVTSDPDGTKPMSRINQGEPVYLKYGFKNLAGHAAMKGFFNSFTLNGKTSFTNRWEYSTLKAGEWGWGGAYWCPTELQNLPQGTYTLKCELDVTDVLKNEASERDNSRTITFTIGPASCTVTFNPNGGTVSPTTRSVAKGATVGTLPTPIRPGYIFDGWHTSIHKKGVRISPSTIVTDNVIYYAHWVEMNKGVIDIAFYAPEDWNSPFFVAGGSNRIASKSSFKVGEPIYLKYAFANLAQKDIMYGFVNRFTLSNGVAFYDNWSAKALGGGRYAYTDDTCCPDALQNLPVGSYTLMCFLDATDILNETNEGNNIRTISFTVREEGNYVLYGNAEGSIPETTASVYDGYLYLGDKVVGSIQAKVSKPKFNNKLDLITAKTSVIIQITGEKKVSLNGEMDIETGVLIVAAKDGRVLSLEFGEDGLFGAFGNYEISGVRNLFSSKDKAEKATADEMLAPWIGAMNMITGDGTLSVTIAKKGKVTVKGTIDGEKISAKAQALIGEDMICIPVIYSKKTVKLAFTIWLPLDGGEAEVVGLDGAIIGKAGTLKAGAKFYIDDAIISDIEGIVMYNGKPALPDGESVSQSKTKWVVADGVKAAKVAYKKGVLSITEGKKGAGIANISGLKLTYKSKDGSFKGSFTVYAIENGKLKKHKASISGVLVNGIGYGTATIKKIGAWAIEIK